MEKARGILRKVLGPRSRLYSAGSKTLNFIATVWKEDYSTWLLFRKLRRGSQTDPNHSVTLRNLREPFLVRPGPEDVNALIQNVIREEYGRFPIKGEIRWMIDAGAYVGDTAAYFLSRFPGLKVIALEPNEENFAIARRNLQHYGERAVLLREALFATDEDLLFAGKGTSGSISSVGSTVSCTTIPNILRRFSINRVDILKMDIEGAEEAIFLDRPERWLRHIDLLIIEMHGARIESLVTEILLKNGFSMRRFRSVWYCRATP